MTRFEILLAFSAGTAVSASAWTLLRPPRRLRARVAPYVQVARTRLLRGTDPRMYLEAVGSRVGMRDVFAPLVERLS